VTWNSDYLGPAALNRAWTLQNDERDGGGEARLAAISAAGGCHACHTHQSCERHCPQSLNPTASIAGLKRQTVEAYITGAL
jgi:fumarate reductase iron-sulfur subunit